MAHFISDVTHQKLDQRREEVVCTYTKGLHCMNEFVAYIRCVEVVSHHCIPGTNESLLWTGNQDGTISVRRGALGEVVHQIDRKRNVFVYCLLQWGTQMWAGLSDGYLRIFDIETYALMFETKMHAGGITSLTFVNGSIFSGSYDWQILQWDPSEVHLVPRGQYSGHQNAVRCMVTDGTMLYSGGDDHAIRCWDLELGQERGAPWPIIGHRSGVRALCIVDVYLFSGSQDGTVKVWNTQTAQLVRVLDRRESAVYALMRDDSCYRVWAGNTDGSINVWNATTLEPVSTMTDHTGSSVCRLHAISRINATKVWSYAQDGTVRVWFSESDPTSDSSEYKLLDQSENEHHHQVEAMRNAIIQNYGELEQRRAELDAMEFLENQRKSKMMVSMIKRQANQLRYKYYEKFLAWSVRSHLCRRLRFVASSMEGQSQARVRRTYYGKLLNFLQYSKECTRKQKLGDAILRNTENGLKTLYLRNLLDFANQAHQAETRRIAVNSIGRSTNRGLQRICFTDWASFLEKRKMKHQGNRILQVVRKAKDQQLLTHYWHVMKNQVDDSRQAQKEGTALSILKRGMNLSLYRTYYDKLSRNTQKNLVTRCHFVADALMSGADSSKMRLYYDKMMRFAAYRRSKPLEDQLKEYDDKVRDIETLVRRHGGVTEKDLERDLESRNIRLKYELSRSADYNKEMGELETDIRRMKMEARNGGRALENTLSEEAQIDQAMLLLKVHLNCDTHFEHITDAHHKGVQDPEKLFDGGVRKVAAVYREVLLPNDLYNAMGEWRVDLDAIDKVVKSRKLSKKALEGIAEVILGSDMLAYQTDSNTSAEWIESASAGKYQKEFITNVGCFIDLIVAMQLYQEELAVKKNGRRSSLQSTSSNASFRNIESGSQFGSGFYSRSGSISGVTSPLSPPRTSYRAISSSPGGKGQQSSVTNTSTLPVINKKEEKDVVSHGLSSHGSTVKSISKTTTTHASSKNLVSSSSTVSRASVNQSSTSTKSTTQNSSFYSNNKNATSATSTTAATTTAAPATALYTSTLTSSAAPASTYTSSLGQYSSSAAAPASTYTSQYSTSSTAVPTSTYTSSLGQYSSSVTASSTAVPASTYTSSLGQYSSSTAAPASTYTSQYSTSSTAASASTYTSQYSTSNVSSTSSTIPVTSYTNVVRSTSTEPTASSTSAAYTSPLSSSAAPASTYTSSLGQYSSSVTASSTAASASTYTSQHSTSNAGSIVSSAIPATASSTSAAYTSTLSSTAAAPASTYTSQYTTSSVSYVTSTTSTSTTISSLSSESTGESAMEKFLKQYSRPA